jgi:hypothetical protein
MPNFLTDPSPTMQFLAIIGLVIAIAVWYRYRDKKTLIAMIIVTAVVATLFTISWFWKSPREHAIDRATAITNAMNRFDLGRALENVSDNFNYKGCRKKDLKQAELNSILRSENAVISLWGFSRDEVVYSADGNSCEIGFGANVSGHHGSRPGFYVKMTVAKDADGEFRTTGFKVYEDYLKKENGGEFQVPGMNRK